MEQRIDRSNLHRALFVGDPPALHNESVTFIYGVSGVGKSTLCDQLISGLSHKGVEYVSSGSIARKLADSGESEIAGQYYNDECALWREMAEAWFSALCNRANKHILIDGYLRRPFQVLRVMDFMLYQQESATIHPGTISFVYVEQEEAGHAPQYEGVNAARVLLCEAKEHENELHGFNVGRRASWMNYVLPHWSKDEGEAR